MKEKCVLGVLVGLMFCFMSQAQYYMYKDYYEPALVYEVGAGMGTVHALTDLGGRSGSGKSFIGDLNLSHLRPGMSVYLMALFRQIIGLRFEYMLGTVYSADEVLAGRGESTFGRYERNLSFRSRIRELQLGMEIYPFAVGSRDDAGPPAASPYTLIGAGYYQFSPHAWLDGQWYALKPLRTEGQGFAEYPSRKPYALGQFNMGCGAGIRWRISDVFALRLEICHRFLWTDYLDDVSMNYVDPVLFDKYLPPEKAAVAKQLYSRKHERDPAAVTSAGDQRGNPSNRDSYFTVMIKTGFIPARKKK